MRAGAPTSALGIKKVVDFLCLTLLLVAAIMVCFSSGTTAAPAKKGGGPLKNIYPYYWKQETRYPFYDKHGRGKLLYGYGGPELFEYTAFKPIEGYYRRR